MTFWLSYKRNFVSKKKTEYVQYINTVQIFTLSLCARCKYTCKTLMITKFSKLMTNVQCPSLFMM